MNSIIELNLFEDNKLGDLEKLYTVLEALPDEKLMDLLVKELAKYQAEKVRYLLADRRYDGQPLMSMLEPKKIIPIIDIKNMCDREKKLNNTKIRILSTTIVKKSFTQMTLERKNSWSIKNTMLLRIAYGMDSIRRTRIIDYFGLREMKMSVFFQKSHVTAVSSNVYIRNGRRWSAGRNKMNLSITMTLVVMLGFAKAKLTTQVMPEKLKSWVV